MGNETVETVYGSVEVDTVECESCGETILREDGYRFGMSTNPHKKINDSKYNGYACEHCASVGPASFPERLREYALPRGENGLFWGYVITAPALCPIVVSEALFTDVDEFYSGYFIAIVSVILWVAFSLLVFHLVFH